MATWHATVDDLVGGWVVANFNRALSDTDLRGGHSLVLAYFITTKEEAEAMASALNEAGVTEEQVRAWRGLPKPQDDGPRQLTWYGTEEPF